MSNLAKFAQIVDEAARTAAAIPQFTESAPLGVEEAYAIQALSIGAPICPWRASDRREDGPDLSRENDSGRRR